MKGVKRMYTRTEIVNKLSHKYLHTQSRLLFDDISGSYLEVITPNIALILDPDELVWRTPHSVISGKKFYESYMRSERITNFDIVKARIKIDMYGYKYSWKETYKIGTDAVLSYGITRGVFNKFVFACTLVYYDRESHLVFLTDENVNPYALICPVSFIKYEKIGEFIK